MKTTYIRNFIQSSSFCAVFLLLSCNSGRTVNVPEYSKSGPVEYQARSQSKDGMAGKTIDESQIHEHLLWSELLANNVDEMGKVDYQGFVSESKKLTKYLQQLSKHYPRDKWSYNEKKAFWINAYNAFTVKLICDNYPVKSIKELGGSIYKVNTTWDIKFIKIGEKTYDLNNIEHNILRKEFADPRLHSALNCASISCPKLRTEAYTPAKLENQLDDQMNYFINNEQKNKLGANKIKISPIFKWFSGDFTKNKTIIEYLNEYSKVKIDKNADIAYMDYNWDLNE